MRPLTWDNILTESIPPYGLRGGYWNCYIFAFEYNPFTISCNRPSKQYKLVSSHHMNVGDLRNGTDKNRKKTVLVYGRLVLRF